MKLLIMSDTHGDAEVIQRVRERHENIDVTIHCGDSELPYDHPYFEDVIRVRGNCDRTDKRFPVEEIIYLNEEKLFVTHGHLFDVKSSLLKLIYRAKEEAATICCFGHTHLLGAELIDGVLMINPGSLLKPRGRKEKSYVTVDIESDVYTITCYSDDGDVMESLRIYS